MLKSDILYYLKRNFMGFVLYHEPTHLKKPGWHLGVFSTELKTKPGLWRTPIIGHYKKFDRAVARAQALLEEAGYGGKLRTMLRVRGWAVLLPDGTKWWFYTRAEAKRESEKLEEANPTEEYWLEQTTLRWTKLADKEEGPVVIEPEPSPESLQRPGRSEDAEWNLKQS